MATAERISLTKNVRSLLPTLGNWSNHPPAECQNQDEAMIIIQLYNWSEPLGECKFQLIL